MKYLTLIAASLLLTSLCYAQPLPSPQPFSVQLEEAIYTEEVLGDSLGAQQRYQQLITDAGSINAIAAEAYARLIHNLHTSGNDTLAKQRLAEFSKTYPDQTQWLTFAKNALGIQPFASDSLIPAPWVDGEKLYYQRKNLGRHILFHNMQIKTALPENQWQTDIMLYHTDSNHREYWQTQVAGRSNQLITATLKMMNTKDRLFTVENGKLTINDLEQGTTFSLPKEAHEYDQGLLNDVLRRLAYAPNYKTTLALVQNIKANITTIQTDATVNVAAGQFHCFLVELELTTNNDTMTTAKAWISNDANRYLVKYENGDLTDELQSIRQFPEGVQHFKDAKGVSYSLPENWTAFYQNAFEPAKSQTYIQPMRIDLRAADLSVFTRTDIDWSTVTRDDAITELNNWDYSWLKSYVFIPESVEHLTINDLPAVAFQAEVVFKEQPLIYYRVVIAKAPKVAVMSFYAHKSDFPQEKAVFDQIAHSLAFDQ